MNCIGSISRSFSTSSITTPPNPTTAGPMYSFRGIDNSTYYALEPGRSRGLCQLQCVRQRSADCTSGSCEGWSLTACGIGRARWAWTVSASILPLSSRVMKRAASIWKIRRLSRKSLAIQPLKMRRLIAEPWQGEPGSGYMMGRAFPGRPGASGTIIFAIPSEISSEDRRGSFRRLWPGFTAAPICCPIPRWTPSSVPERQLRR